MATPGSGNPRTRLALSAAVVLCLLLAPIATAGAESRSGNPKATASVKVKKKIKKLNKKFKKKFKKLQAQLEEVSKQPGPQGPQGEKGDQGDPGPQGPPGSSNGWALAGNAGTNPGSQFLGTTDNIPLNLRVNDSRALRLEPATDRDGNQSPNVIGGIADNSVAAGAHSATIGGGGSSTDAPGAGNRITDEAGTVGGGAGNEVGNGDASPINAGVATVGGGEENGASAGRSTVGGGAHNSATGAESVIGGGFANAATGFDGTVGGGDDNLAGGQRSTVGGGFDNHANQPFSTVGGGELNRASGSWSTVGGGADNHVNNLYGTVPGGRANTAGSPYSLAAGRRGQAIHDGAFVWADSRDFDFRSTAANEFSARTTGGARFVSAIDGTGTPTAGVTLAAGGGSWASLSDEASKRRIDDVSGREVLASLASIPISEWSYRSQGPGVRHIGPMAQDFHRAFGVGEDARHITSIDADGVALAAIKGLNSTVDRQDRRIARLESRISALERNRR